MTVLSRAWELFTSADTKAQERLPISSGANFVSGGLLNTSNNNGSAQTNMQRYGEIGWLFAVVARIASSVGSVKWRLYRKLANNEFEEVLQHPALDLWQLVNPYYTRIEFLETIQNHVELAGETYWHIIFDGDGPPNGKPVELWPLRPDLVTPIASMETFIGGYQYRMGGQVYNLMPWEVLCVKMPSPLDVYRGQGPVGTLHVDLDNERNAALWSRSFFRNSAQPSGIIKLDRSLDDEQFNEFVQRWQSQHQGIGNAHRVAILEHGEWQDRKITQRDMQFDAGRRWNRDVIFGAFGIHGSIMGVTENINRANAEAAEVHYARWLITPRLVRIKEALNERLLPFFGDPTLVFDFDDPVPANRELRLQEAKEGFVSGFLTKNEARSRLGEGEIEGGDEFFTPPTAPVARAIAPVEVKDADPADIKPDPIDSAEMAMQTAWGKRLSKEATSIASYLVNLTKAEVTDLDGYDWNWGNKYGTAVETELRFVHAASLEIGFPGMGPDQVARLSSAYADQRAAELLMEGEAVLYEPGGPLTKGHNSLVDLTRKHVRELVVHNIETGESLNKLRRSIMDDLAFSKARADMIARTETATAFGQGQMTAAKSQNKNEKRWVTQADEAVDVDCVVNAADGWIGMEQPFSSGQDTVPAHPSCRCTVVYRTKKLHMGISALVEKVVCPTCEKRLPINNVPRGTEAYCKRCNATFRI
jgi:HK97 family phage portal protein